MIISHRHKFIFIRTKKSGWDKYRDCTLEVPVVLMMSLRPLRRSMKANGANSVSLRNKIIGSDLASIPKGSGDSHFPRSSRGQIL